jgi:hypothetical protein
MTTSERDALRQAVGKLDARLLRDETGREIKGAHWVKRDDVVELVMRAEAGAASRFAVDIHIDKETGEPMRTLRRNATPSVASPQGGKLIAKWESYIEKMRTGSVNFVHESTKMACQDLIDLAQHFVDDLRAAAPVGEPGRTPSLDEMADWLRVEYPTYGAGERLSLPATIDVVSAIYAKLGIEKDGRFKRAIHAPNGGKAAGSVTVSQPETSGEPEVSHESTIPLDTAARQCNEEMEGRCDCPVHKAYDRLAAPPAQGAPTPEISAGGRTYNVIGCSGEGKHCVCVEGYGHKKYAQTPIPVPLAEKSKEGLVRIVEMMTEDLNWYVGERNRLLAAQGAPGTREWLSETETLAKWMQERSFSTGHGDDVESLLSELSWQIAEMRRLREVSETALELTAKCELPAGYNPAQIARLIAMTRTQAKRIAELEAALAQPGAPTKEG